MAQYRKAQLNKLAKHIGPHILRTALAIKHATTGGKKMTAQERRLVYSHLMPEFVDAIIDTFDLRYSLRHFLQDESIRWSFLELIVAIELINVCKGRKPSNDFIKAFKLCTPGKGNESIFLYHLATLFYFDKRNKLFKAIINHRDLPSLSSSDIIKLARKAVWKESRASLSRLDSDSVKIKGAVKDAEILPFDDTKVGVKTVDPYQQIYQVELIKNLRKDLNEYIAKSHRSRRKRNIMAFVDYTLTNKETDINIKKAATELKISRKTLHQIKKSLQENVGFKRLLNALRLNNK
ncbi:MAG: hypothetical protein PHH68_05300 [Candidatus Omnitrophica bacterium]|nr:hypothetical protein [Candidatus Omnitrophota bacterium]